MTKSLSQYLDEFRALQPTTPEPEAVPFVLTDEMTAGVDDMAGFRAETLVFAVIGFAAVAAICYPA